MGAIMLAVKTLENVTDLAKKLTIFNAVLNTKVAWDTVPESNIFRCFRQCSIHEHMAQQQELLDDTQPTSPNDSNDFDGYFKTLWRASWDEYMAYRVSFKLSSYPRCMMGRATRPLRWLRLLTQSLMICQWPLSRPLMPLKLYANCVSVTHNYFSWQVTFIMCFIFKSWNEYWIKRHYRYLLWST